jgi:hypothetical protein
MSTSISSLDPGSLYWTLMGIYRAGLARFGGHKFQTGDTPEEAFKSDIKPSHVDHNLSQLAQVFTSAANAGHLATTSESETADCLRLSEIALMSAMLMQIGEFGHMTQDSRDKMIALLEDFEIKAPELAVRLKERLSTKVHLKSA